MESINRELQIAAKRNEELTSTKAAELAEYSRDHIGLLLRRKLIIGEKIGRDWMVSAKSLHDYIKKNPKPGPKTA